MKYTLFIYYKCNVIHN